MNSDWQPMDTAPKDGTEILGYADGDITTVRWVVNTGWLQEDGYWTLVVAGTYASDGEWWPTHWLPLPEPPSSAQAKIETKPCRSGV